MFLVAKEVCEAVMPFPDLVDDDFCAIGFDPDSPEDGVGGACMGDYGGPLYDSENNTVVGVSVTSFVCGTSPTHFAPIAKEVWLQVLDILRYSSNCLPTPVSRIYFSSLLSSFNQTLVTMD